MSTSDRDVHIELAPTSAKSRVVIGGHELTPFVESITVTQRAGILPEVSLRLHLIDGEGFLYRGPAIVDARFGKDEPMFSAELVALSDEDLERVRRGIDRILEIRDGYE